MKVRWTWTPANGLKGRSIPLLLAVVTLLCTGLWLTTTSPAAVAQDDEGDRAGYVYTVQEGDSWDSVAELTGVSVADLQEANPDALRDSDWLLVGEDIFVPIDAGRSNRVHTVDAGESWNSIAEQYGISAGLLRAANPSSVRTGNILYRGEELTVPPAGATLPTDTPTAAPGTADEATATPEPTQEDADADVADAPVAITTMTATVTSEATATATPITGTEEVTAAAGDITATGAVTAGETITGGDAVTGTGALSEEIVLEVELPACPERFADYPQTMTDLINLEDGGPEAVIAFLSNCEALVEDGMAMEDLTGDDVDDLVVVYQNPSAEQIFVEGDLAIFNSSEDGYTLAYRARAAGEVRLLSVGDVNDDGLVDVVWVDTTCGASTCFDTINVRSWDTTTWADWTDGTITMAYAEISLDDRAEEGMGQEIVLEGGIYGSVGAGPQRSRTEVWASLEDAPYSMLEKTYSPSECLYHTVLDGNRAFLEAPTEGFEAATAFYTEAVTDDGLIKCWVRNNELEELRSFSRFRLALIAGYQGDEESAAEEIATLSDEFSDSVYDEVGAVWLDAYESSGDAAEACEEVTAFAEENSLAWEILADYGYTNPSFEAADVCPILDVGAEPDEGADDGAGGDDPSGDSDTEETEEGEDDSSSSSVLSPPVATSMPDTMPDSNAADPEILAGLPDCPDELAGYAEAMPDLLAMTADTPPRAVHWLEACGAANSPSEPLAWVELNDDGIPDAIAYPTVITDTGLGPDGAQGAVFILHSRLPITSGEDTSYRLIAAPDTFGVPQHLAAEDLNLDGRADVAWGVVGCGTTCVLNVQIYTWDGDAYLALIRPGASIPNGAAMWAPVEDDDAGIGQKLILSGGVSDTSAGGLAVPHEETWQSVQGGLYTRHSWQYDRSVEESNCLGLRLVEADVALQAAPYLGYGPAIERYAAALDPALEACSIFDLDTEAEMIWLQGLAAFRLIQSHALDGDLETAEAVLTSLAAGQPESAYTQAASEWFATLQETADPVQACIAIEALIDANPMMWQITDHFGYDHPALGPTEVCYIP